MIAKFFVDGIPIPKARPRVTRWGTYTPKTTVDWEKLVAVSYKNQCKGIFFEKKIPLYFYAEIICPGTGPLSTIRGDWENFAKGICDALNEVAYDDDSQIVDGRTVKRRAKKGEKVGANVTIKNYE